MTSGDENGRDADGPPPGLHVEHDMAFQRREWAVQRVGWAAGLVVLAAALAGLLGNGPLSRAEAWGAGDALRVRYERIARDQASTDLRIVADIAAGAETTLWISRGLAERMEIESVTPEPVRSWGTPARTGFVFAPPAAGPSSGSTGPGERIEVVIRVKLGAIGWVRGEVGMEGRDPPARLSVLALP